MGLVWLLEGRWGGWDFLEVVWGLFWFVVGKGVVS